MTANISLIEQYNAVDKRIEVLRRENKRFIDYGKNGMTNAQKIEAHYLNESIMIPTPEFSDLLIKRREFSNLNCFYLVELYNS